jgi:spermidine/putrescine transport system permease protein
VLLALLIAPFWISYMMRMLAWVNLLQNDGLVNRVLSLGGLADVSIDWLNGRSSSWCWAWSTATSRT